MGSGVARLRMFAGPNGSGKSTITSLLEQKLLGVYVNPDDIEEEMHRSGFLDLTSYGIQASSQEVLEFFIHSPLVESAHLSAEVQRLRYANGKIMFRDVSVNAYFAAVAADFIRARLLEAGISFTSETVMSFPDKVVLLAKAQAKGYRTYLYYVATENPAINISRVRHRVHVGGHAVPEEKIVSRYHRSLDLLANAVRCTHRAYIFDNSGPTYILLAEITDGHVLEMKVDTMPAWFKKALWDTFPISKTGQ